MPTSVVNISTASLDSAILSHAIRVSRARFAYGDGSSVNLFELPGNALVLESYVNVSTAFDASGASAAATATISIPVSTGPLVIWDAGNTRLQALYGSQSSAFGVTPASGGMVTLAFTANTTTTGQAEVFLIYATEADKL